MPWTGDDAFGPFDPGGLPYTGPGLDPSYYYALGSGSRFPGDTENSMEWQNAHARGTAGGNPAYDVPDFLTRLPGALGALFRGHEGNAQHGGEGQSPDLPGGYGYNFFSGPGADYGPPGGPLHGLADMGRGGIWDLPEHRPEGESTVTNAGGGRGRGGGGGGVNMNNLGIGQGGSNFRSSFVDWQPITNVAGPHEPTRFVQGPAGPGVAAAAQQGRHGGRGGGGTGTGRAGAGADGGRGRGARGATAAPTGTGAGAGAGTIPPPGSGGMPTDPATYFQEVLRRLQHGTADQGFGPHVSAAARPAIEGGVNVNNLDFATPGWIRDRSAGTHNTSGFPDATIPAPNQGESIDQYRTRLHDAGYDQDTILSMTGPNGYRFGDDGSIEWGWGTGPVVRGPGGYTFAREASSGGGASGRQDGMDDFYTTRTPGSGGSYAV